MNYSTNNHSVPNDYHHYSIRYHPQSSFIYSHEQIINMNQSFRPQSLTRTSESSSGNDSITSDSEPLVIRYDSPSSSPCSRRVIIKSPDQMVTMTNRYRHRKTQRKDYSYTKKSNSTYEKYHSSFSDQRKYKEERLKYLFEQYSNENTRIEWKPLTVLESRELYQYAFDKHKKNSRVY